jgi:hypothetical protein
LGLYMEIEPKKKLHLHYITWIRNFNTEFALLILNNLIQNQSESEGK